MGRFRAILVVDCRKSGGRDERTEMSRFVRLDRCILDRFEGGV